MMNDPRSTDFYKTTIRLEEIQTLFKSDHKFHSCMYTIYDVMRSLIYYS